MTKLSGERLSRRRLLGDHCQCSGPPFGGCGEHFNSTYAFDKHRTGDPGTLPRRCLSPDEMRAKGMVITDGWWVSRMAIPRGHVSLGEAIVLEGPCVVVYPEGTWYTYVDEHDIDEIVESHLKNGRVVERLKI